MKLVDQDAEVSVLYNIALMEDFRSQIFSELKANDFLIIDNQRLFMEALNCWERDIPINSDLIERIVMLSYNRNVLDFSVAMRILQELSYKRNISNLNGQLSALLSDNSASSDQINNLVSSMLVQAQPVDHRFKPQHISEPLKELDEYHASDEKKMFFQIGFKSLTSVWLEAGTMLVVGARPSVGKTVFATTVTRYVAENIGPVLFICIEMDNMQISRRFITTESDTGYQDLLLKTFDKNKVDKSMDNLKGLPIYLFCGKRISIQGIESLIKNSISKGIRLVVIDYIQRIKQGTGESERIRVGKISSQIKEIGLEYGVPMMVLSQLNRAAVDDRPSLKHLKETGDIEQDADIIILLDRKLQSSLEFDRSYKKGNIVFNEEKHAAAIVAKNRNNTTDLAILEFNGKSMLYKDADPYDNTPEYKSRWEDL